MSKPPPNRDGIDPSLVLEGARIRKPSSRALHTLFDPTRTTEKAAASKVNTTKAARKKSAAAKPASTVAIAMKPGSKVSPHTNVAPAHKPPKVTFDLESSTDDDVESPEDPPPKFTGKGQGGKPLRVEDDTEYVQSSQSDSELIPLDYHNCRNDHGTTADLSDSSDPLCLKAPTTETVILDSSPDDELLLPAPMKKGKKKAVTLTDAAGKYL